MPKMLAIVPAYNEEENILRTCQELEKCSLDLDYLVINDASTDRTKEVCEENNLPHINLIHNLGIGGAVQTGYKYGLENGYDLAVQFDGDGQHNADYLEALAAPVLSGEADLCLGSRFLEKDKAGYKSTGARRMGIKIISQLIKWMTGKKIYDPTSGFRACNRTVIELFADSYPVEYPEPESLVRLLKENMRIKEVPVAMNSRAKGVSSINSWSSFYYMINVCLAIIMERFRKR